MASSGWIADRAKEIMTTEPNIGPKALQDRLEKKYNVTLRYGRTWEGLQKAKDDIHGSWEASFQLLWSFKAEVERSMPGSIVDIDVNAMGEKVFFRRLFVALKPCIDGFLLGCRPYLGCDSSFLTRKYTWQIAAAVGVDGHNWLFPMAYAIFDKENYENWEWFMQRLKQAVGTRDGLVIHTDACKGLQTAISDVFGQTVEYRECFRHLMLNFSKKFRGEVFDSNMWPAAWTFSLYKYQEYMDQIKEACPAAYEYLEVHHPHTWTRSKFSEACKIEYVCNNLAESFNAWISDIKGLPIIDLVNKLRQMIMKQMSRRKRVAEGLTDKILPSVVRALNAKSRGLNYEIARSGLTDAEVTVFDMKTKKHNTYGVFLEK